MIRFLSVTEDKNLPIRKASAEMKRGAAIVVNHVDDTVAPASAETGIFLVDVAPNYDGINAVITPNDSAFEKIEAGQNVISIPVYVGERFATTECADGLSMGAGLKAEAGEFVAADGAYEFVFKGEYSDPTGLKMYIVEKVAPVAQA